MNRPYDSAGRTPRRAPRPLVESLNRLLGGLGAPPADTLASLTQHWEAVVGAVVGVEPAAAGRPVRLVHRRLLVEVSDAAALARLRWSEQAILAALNERLGAGRVQQIRLYGGGEMGRESTRGR